MSLGFYRIFRICDAFPEIKKGAKGLTSDSCVFYNFKLLFSFVNELFFLF